MKIAVAFDFNIIMNTNREGIIVFAIHLLNAIMKNYSDVELEFWTYSYNTKYIPLIFNEIFEKYPDRVKIFDDLYDGKRKISLKNRISCFFAWLRILKYRLRYFLFRKKAYIDKINWIISRHYIRSYGGMKNMQDSLISVIKKHSSADCIYCLFINLQVGKYFDLPKFVQVHDLFTIPLFDLFKEDLGEKNLQKYNNEILQNLGEYAKQNTLFISSSEYVAKNHSLKYIPNIKSEQLAVCSFPPMIKNFNVEFLMDKDTFKSKYKIGDMYIAYPSQNRSNKNWIVILEALKILKDKGVNIQFVTTGKISDVVKTKKFVKKNNLEDLIVEVGSLPVDELYALYKYSNLVVASTIMEGIGISGQVIEVLKVGGVPVIHTKSLGIKESLKNVGLTMKEAELNWFDFDDSETLAKLIEEVIKNPQPHIEKQKKVLDAYTQISWKDVADNYMKLFESKK